MKIHSPAWHDHMYNNRARVADFAEQLALWSRASIQARERLPHREWAYGPGPLDTLDVFPAPGPKAPVVVFIHGGYWRSMDKRDHSFVAEPLHALGACTVVVNYDLCPGSSAQPVSVPHIALQMTRALAWVWQHMDELGGDRSRLHVMGHSAGGHLAAMLLGCHWPAVHAGLPRQVLRSALSISGLFDLGPIRRTPFLQTDLRLTPAQVKKASPALWPAPQRGRLMSVVGGDETEEFVRQHALIQAAWGRRAVPHTEVLPGLNHFSILSEWTRPGSRLNALAAQCLSL